MANYDNIKEKGNRFSSTYQPTNRGRKKSLFKQLSAQWISNGGRTQLSREDYLNAIAFLIEMTVDELKAINKDTTTPIWVKSVIAALVKDIKTGRITTLNLIFDRLLGKPSAEFDAQVKLRGSIPIRAWVEDRLKQGNETFK